MVLLSLLYEVVQTFVSVNEILMNLTGEHLNESLLQQSNLPEVFFAMLHTFQVLVFNSVIQIVCCDHQPSLMK